MVVWFLFFCMVVFVLRVENLFFLNHRVLQNPSEIGQNKCLYLAELRV